VHDYLEVKISINYFHESRAAILSTVIFTGWVEQKFDSVKFSTDVRLHSVKLGYVRFRLGCRVRLTRRGRLR